MRHFGTLEAVLKRRYGGGTFADVCSAAYASLEDPTRARLQFLAAQSALPVGHPERLVDPELEQASRLVLKDIAPAAALFRGFDSGFLKRALLVFFKAGLALLATLVLMTLFTGPWLTATFLTVVVGAALLVLRLRWPSVPRVLCSAVLSILVVTAFMTVLPVGVLSLGAVVLFSTSILF
ncbi:hypothetical protein BH24DEI2_BH24DEI2_27700 [soil metagenome]